MYYFCGMEFEWIKDIPGDHFTSNNLDELFEYIKPGDTIYIRGFMGGWCVFVNDFGMVIRVCDDLNSVTIQFEKEIPRLTTDRTLYVPKLYENIPSLHVGEQYHECDFCFTKGSNLVIIPRIYELVIPNRKIVNEEFDFHIIERA